jgi:hypothetical protein
MTGKSDTSNSQVVYLLKSTFYPDFRQKVLSLLSLPNNLEQIIEYDSKWIDEEIKERPEKFEGMDACAIFCDYSSDLLNFWPLRLCKISRIIPPVDGVTYQIILKTGDYRTATVADEFSSKVRTYLEEKQIVKKENAVSWPNKLVFCGDESILKMLAQIGDQQTTWENTIEYLVKVPDIKRGIDQEQFKHSVFYRLNVLARDELGSPLSLKDGAYEFYPGKQYSLTFAVYHPHYTNFDAQDLKENAVDFPEEMLRHVGPKTFSLPARQRKYTKYFDFWAKDLMVGGKSRLVVRLEKEEFNGPYIQIPFVLRCKRLQLVSLFFSLTIGLFILGSSSAIASIAASYGLTFISQWVVGMVGTVLSAAPIAWLQLRRFT